MTERTEREERDARVIIGTELNRAYDEILVSSDDIRKDHLLDELGNLKDVLAKNEYKNSEKSIRKFLKTLDKELPNGNSHKQTVMSALDNIRKTMIRDLWDIPKIQNSDSF